MIPTKRVVLNLVVFLAAAVVLISLGLTKLVLPQAQGTTVSAEFRDAGGIAPRNDVTMRGVVVGGVTSVELTRYGTRVEMTLQPGIRVPQGTEAEIVRRSAIGDLVVNLQPGDGPALADGASIPMEDTSGPVRPERTVEVLAEVLHAVPSENLSVLTSEAANALRGRGDDLARLSEAGADLPQRILEVNRELRQLLTTGPKVTGVLAAHAPALAEDVTRTRQLAEILRDNRFELVSLYRNGARFTEVANDVLFGAEGKANLSCFVAAAARSNSVLGSDANLRNLKSVLALNHYFFDAFEQMVQRGIDGRDWFRVHLLPHTEPAPRSYDPHRAAPDVYAANSCRSPFGDGVGPGHQRIPVRLLGRSRIHPGR